MNFKLSVDEDILAVDSKPGLIETILFFKHWSYRFELPINKISRIIVENRLGVNTLVVYKTTKSGEEKAIPVSLGRANSNQFSFIKSALPKIVSNKLKMPEIKRLQREFHLLSA